MSDRKRVTSLMRPVTVDKVNFEFDDGVAFTGHQYWIIDNLGEPVYACSSPGIADEMARAINESSGDIDLTALMCKILKRQYDRTGSSVAMDPDEDVDIIPIDPEEEAKTDGWYQEQKEMTEVSDRKRQHFKRRGK